MESPSAESLFESAVRLNQSGERRAYLDQACEGAPELRARVEALLAAHEEGAGSEEPTLDGPGEAAAEPMDENGAARLLGLQSGAELDLT
ncbi:MAG: hypothetical protein GWM87_06530, partial [Xanthomonadales bacterium]|nr:hypothetical protein [Xanthomonadales bacterium]NIX12625.1 hypothetical protein [Xanthomonadales bacterium]